MRDIWFLVAASFLSISVFIVAGLILPFVAPVEAGSVESSVYSACIALIVFIIAERFFDNIAIISPINKVVSKFENLADKYVGLHQAASFELFFQRAKSAALDAATQVLDDYWIAIRRDARRDVICMYIHRIRKKGDEFIFSSFDENSPGEKYFVDGVLCSLSNQATLYGKVRGKNSLHIYSLFVPAGERPPYLFGTHFQTTLSGASSISTPVVFLRVRDASIPPSDRSVDLESSRFIEEFKDLAKRHSDTDLADALRRVDGCTDLHQSGISIDSIIQFLRAGRGSVEVDSGMMDRHLKS